MTDKNESYISFSAPSTTAIGIKDWSPRMDPAIEPSTSLRQSWKAGDVTIVLTVRSDSPLFPEIYNRLHDVIATIEELTGFISDTSTDEK